MNTIVKHKRTGNEYILLGINGELDKTNPSRFISELFTQEKSEASCSATVCDVQGNIFLAYIDDLIVTQINGEKPADILPEPILESVKDNLNNELEEKDFDKNPDINSETQTSSVYTQGSSNQDDFEAEDDEDWI